MLALKKFLIVSMLIGAAAYFGGGSTFASFNAETTNSGSSIASGTLTLDNTVNTGTACMSAQAVTADNVNAACDALMTLTNVAPGVYGGVADVTVQNSGSIDASKFYLWAAPVMARLNAPVANAATVSSLTILPLQGAVTAGDHIVVGYGSSSQEFIANAARPGGSTTIGVTPAAATAAFPVGASVTDTSANTSAANTNCYDAQTTSPGTAGATKGTDLNFNPAANNPLCSTLLIFVQETTGGKNYCWVGKGSSPQPANGFCTAPISVTLSQALPATPITALPVSALNGNVSTGDQIVVRSGSTTQTFVASGPAGFGATSIPINSATPTIAFPIGSTLTDPTTLGTLNSDQLDTITNFDTAHNGNVGKIQLHPVTAAGTLNTNASVQLSHFQSGTYSRTFKIGVYFPAPASVVQNPLQGLVSTFGITWHIDQ